jgi:hypothetical protein
MKKSKQKKLDDARIQRAITGLQIPMLRTVELYKHLEAGIFAGDDDEDLRLRAVLFLQGGAACD